MSKKNIFLLLTILVAAIYAWPGIHFIDALSTGDLGRDFYAFDAVNHGLLPYKDFWWVYGPLMPYYYGLFFKIFGVHMPSILLGQAVLSVACAAFFYLAATCLMPASLAFLAASWFAIGRQEFFFTYNHVGGIVMELVIAWGLLAYLQNNAMRYLWMALLADFVLGVIKINFGLAGLVGLVISVAWIDFMKKNTLSLPKKNFYAAALGVIVLWGIIYWALLHELPSYAIHQCMPYLGEDHPYNRSPLVVIPYFFMQQWLTFTHSWPNALIGIVLHGCTIFAAYLLITKKVDEKYRRDILITLPIIGLFFVFYFHEFVVSGVWYRSFWSMPFLSLFHFVMIAVAVSFMPQFLRIMVIVFLWLLVAFSLVVRIGSVESAKAPYRYLNMDRGQVYVGNEPQWTDTVNRVTYYLNTSLKPNELFFALPYDCLYYYLTGKPSPTRQLIFFDHIKVPTEQEISIIQELINHKVNYVVMSNRIVSSEEGLGIFGKTYCPLLAAYIHDNFVPVIRQGGDWNAEPGWSSNHGVIIWKRKSLLN